MSVAIVGAQWGDEGKGKVVDLYSDRADLIVRFQGGNNAGHTLVVGGKKTVLHLVPSGVLHPGKICVIGNGVVFDPKEFFGEIDLLLESGVLAPPASDRIWVSERAHVILPFHRRLDELRETKAGTGKGKIGTTVRGIGPAYEDKAARRGIQVADLIRPNLLKEKLARALEERNILFQHAFNEPAIELEPLYEQCLAIGERLRPFIRDTRVELHRALEAQKKVLFEGAQGTLLDLDHGTYPYVTSSNTTTGGLFTGTGLGPRAVKEVIGITKAYCTRVGTGPFPTEIEQTEMELAQALRKKGAEFGATTGRPRRIGWLDLVALRYAAEVNGLTGLALMKADVLSELEEVKLCTQYRLDGQKIETFPTTPDDLERVEPVYESLAGWKSVAADSKTPFEELPEAFRTFIARIEKVVGVPVVLVSTGPGREETLEVKTPFSVASH